MRLGARLKEWIRNLWSSIVNMLERFWHCWDLWPKESWEEGGLGNRWQIIAEYPRFDSDEEWVTVVLQKAVANGKGWYLFSTVKEILVTTKQEGVDADAKLREWVHTHMARQARRRHLAQSLHRGDKDE